MTIGTVRTQGTELFFINPLGSPSAEMVKLSCPTGISGLGGAADQIEDTCLDTVGDKTFKPGLGNPGQVSVPFNMIPTDDSHQVLFDLKNAGTVLKWIICLSDGTPDPTISAGAFVAPANRTSITFQGYIADVNLDMATNDLVRGTLTIQRSGAVTGHWNAPVPTA
jgi:hypothetical protein